MCAGEAVGELDSTRRNMCIAKVVERSRKLIGDVGPDDLRGSAPLRERLGTQLTGIRASLEDLLVDRPRRRILRSREAVA